MKNKNIITYLLIDNYYFTLNSSIFLKKVIYWLFKCGRSIDGLEGKWIYNTLNDWNEQFPYWSMSTLRRTIKSLEKSGVLLSKKVNAKRWKHTKWYSIDFDKLNEIASRYNSKQNNFIVSADINDETSDTSLVKKRTHRCVQNEQIIYTNNIYTKDTKVSSSKRTKKKKNLNQNFNYKLNKLIEEKINNKLNLKVKNLQNAQKDNLGKEQLEKVKEMKRIWDKVFEYSINPIKAYINKNNEKVLYRLLKERFEGDLNKWKEYAYKVNSSKFLMGEKKTKTGFKASFAWLIKVETVDKINAGEYGIGDRELDQNNISGNIEQQKEELVKVADKKISEYIKGKIDDNTEFDSFKEYIGKNKHLEDEDKYDIGIYVQNIGSYDLINNPDNLGMLKTMYDTYLMKKYFKSSRFKIKEQLREIVNDKVKGQSILENINELRNIKEFIVLNEIDLETSKLKLLR